MTHVLTRIAPTDQIWMTGMMCVINTVGGGRIVKRRRNGRTTFDIEVNRPTLFARMIDDITNSFTGRAAVVEVPATHNSNGADQ